VEEGYGAPWITCRQGGGGTHEGAPRDTMFRKRALGKKSCQGGISLHWGRLGGVVGQEDNPGTCL